MYFSPRLGLVGLEGRVLGAARFPRGLRRACGAALAGFAAVTDLVALLGFAGLAGFTAWRALTAGADFAGWVDLAGLAAFAVAADFASEAADFAELVAFPALSLFTRSLPWLFWLISYLSLLVAWLCSHTALSNSTISHVSREGFRGSQFRGREVPDYRNGCQPFLASRSQKCPVLLRPPVGSC